MTARGQFSLLLSQLDKRFWVSTGFLVVFLTTTWGPFLASTLAFLCIAILSHLAVLQRDAMLPVKAGDIVFGVFLVSLVAGELIINPNINTVLELLRWCSLALIARSLVTVISISSIFAAFALTGGALALATALSAWWDFGLATFDGSKFLTLFMHKNDIAALISLGLVSLLSLLLDQEKRTRSFVATSGWVAFAAMSAIVLLLDSLAASGATLIGVLGLIGARRLRGLTPRARRLWISGFSLSPILLVVLGQVTGLFQMLGRRTDFHGRLEIWGFSVADWGDVWLLGAPGSYWTPERSRAFDESTTLVGPVAVSDNSFLDMFLDNGILPLVIFFGLLGSSMRVFFGHAEPTMVSVSFLAILWVVLTVSFFNSTLLSPYFFFPLALSFQFLQHAKATEKTAAIAQSAASDRNSEK